MDSLYLQLFQALFPQFNFEDIEPGKTEEEMAENIDQLIKLLETNILEHDLSDIKAEAIVSGNLEHIDEFLQVLLQVVFLMLQNQAEGEESEEEMESAQKGKNDKSSSKKQKSEDQRKGRFSDDQSDDIDNKDETDTQKMAKDMGLNSPDIIDEGGNGMGELYDMDDANQKDQRLLRDLEQEYEDKLVEEGLGEPNVDSHSRKKSDKAPAKHEELEDDEHRFSDLDFYGKNPPDHKQVMIDEDEDPEAVMMKQLKKKQEEKDASEAKRQEDSKKKDKGSNKKQEIDIMNDPLLPEGVDFGNKKKNRARADSLGGGGGSFKGHDLLDDQEDDDDLLVIDNLDELDEEQRYMVLQHLFEEYQRDPDSFPEDQKELLENEMMKLYAKAEMEGELDGEGEFEDGFGMAGSSGKKRGYSDDKAKNRWVDDDSDHYENDPMYQGSAKKAKVRELVDDEEDNDDERMQMNGKINMPSDKIPNRDSDADEDMHDQFHDEDEDEKYMKDILQQQNEEKAKREEKQQEMEQHEEEHHEDEQHEEEHDDQMIEITEEEFQKLPPEEQQRMLMMMQQQQMEGHEGEGEGEGDEHIPEVNDQYMAALQQQMMEQEQLARMQKMRRKSKKPKRKRPSTAKYGWNSRSTKLQSKSLKRPGTAKKRKTKTKSNKRRMEEQAYFQQLQQQQILQQLAMQQQLQQQNQMNEEQAAQLQQNIANIQPVDENGNPIEMTEEQLAEFQNNLLQQQLAQHHQDGEGDEEGNELGQYTPEQIAMLQQQAYEQQLREQSMLRRKKGKKRASSKRRASRTKKTKKPRRKKQYMDEQAQFLMMLQQNPELQQQLLQQQQMQAMEEGQMAQEQLYNVDKIEEEENEESPMKSQPHEMKDHERPTEESHPTGDDMHQNQLHHGETDDEGIYEDDEHQQMLNNLSPEELAYLQQKAAHEQQMMGYHPEEMGQYYSPHQGNQMNLYNQQNMVQQNIINQNEALNKMFKNYITEMKKKEQRKARRRLKKQQKSRRRSFAAGYGVRNSTHNVIPYKKGLDLKSKIKRDVKQVMLAKKIYMLANEIERNRLLEEKRRIAESKRLHKTKKKSLKGTMKNKFQDQMALLKQSIESERMDRKIAKFVRTQAMQQWKRDLSRKQPQIQLPMGSYA